jgi:hypothetical protein
MIQKLLKDFKYTILLINKIKLFLYKNIKMVKEINHLVIFYSSLYSTSIR